LTRRPLSKTLTRQKAAAGMSTSESWRSLFESWPESVPRTGLLVSMWNETIPFKDFLISGQLVLLERDAPDSLGSRKVILGYESIAAVKLTTTMELARLQVLGFQAPF